MGERREAEPPDTCVNACEVTGREGGFFTAEAEAGGTGPGLALVEIEDPRGRVGPPLPDGVEQDQDPPAAALLVVRENRFEGVSDGSPRKADPLDDGGGDVDLGVTDPFTVEAGDEIAGEGRIVGGIGQGAADVPVEGKETRRVAGPGAPGSDGVRVGENGVGRASREPDEGRWRDAPLEVQVELDLRSGSEPGEEEAAGTGWRHGTPSYGALPPGVLPPGRRWIRAAAYGVDLLILAGGPLLLSTLAIVVFLLFVSDPPSSLAGGFIAAQVLFAVLFLLRDAGGASPGKRLFGLRLVREGGRPVGILASVTRNIPMLVPGWNVIELMAVMSRRDGRRVGDRLAGTTLVES